LVFPYSETGQVNFVKRLPDNSFVIGFAILAIDTTENTKQTLLTLSPDFTVTEDLKFWVVSNHPGILVGHPWSFINDIIQLPDGKRGYIFTLLGGAAGDEQLIWGSDTLDLGLTPDPVGDYKAFYLKVEGTSCGKKLTHLPEFLYMGRAADKTSTGNFFTLAQKHLVYMNIGNPGFLDTAVLYQFDRNGTLLSQFNLGYPYRVSANVRDPFYGGGVPFNKFVMNQVGNHIYLTCGNHIAKIQVNEVATADESFAGCLSNRTLLTSAKSEVAASSNFVFRTEKGIVFKQTGEEAGQYNLINSQGRMVAKGNLSGDQTEINSTAFSKVIYLLKVTQNDIQKTYRVIW
jgi:hypothetical protein